MTWGDKLKALCPAGSSEKDYFNANVEAVEAALLSARSLQLGYGARVVFNIPNAHLLSFVNLSRPFTGPQNAYKNTYDLESCRIGKAAPVSGKRQKVDLALLPLGKRPDGKEGQPSDIYFGAVELNGTGVRFYGDYCLVLKPDAGPGLTILDRNSYDLDCAPLKARIKAKTFSPADIKGRWESDLGAMAAIKVLNKHSPKDRRLTTGTISDALIADEDYIEVLKLSSFSTFNLQEVRTNAADAAMDAFLGQRIAKGPTPGFSAMLWSLRRRRAEIYMKKAGVGVRVVTNTGRLKS